MMPRPTKRMFVVDENGVRLAKVLGWTINTSTLKKPNPFLTATFETVVLTAGTKAFLQAIGMYPE